MKRILYGLATFFAVACFAGAHALRYAVLRWLTVNRWVMFFTNKMKALLPLSFLKTAVPLLLMALAVLLAVRALRRRPPRSRMLVPEALFGVVLALYYLVFSRAASSATTRAFPVMMVLLALSVLLQCMKTAALSFRNASAAHMSSSDDSGGQPATKAASIP